MINTGINRRPVKSERPSCTFPKPSGKRIKLETSCDQDEVAAFNMEREHPPPSLPEIAEITKDNGQEPLLKSESTRFCNVAGKATMEESMKSKTWVGKQDDAAVKLEREPAEETYIGKEHEEIQSSANGLRGTVSNQQNGSCLSSEESSSDSPVLGKIIKDDMIPLCQTKEQNNKVDVRDEKLSNEKLNHLPPDLPETTIPLNGLGESLKPCTPHGEQSEDVETMSISSQSKELSGNVQTQAIHPIEPTGNDQELPTQTSEPNENVQELPNEKCSQQSVDAAEIHCQYSPLTENKQPQTKPCVASTMNVQTPCQSLNEPLENVEEPSSLSCELSGDVQTPPNDPSDKEGIKETLAQPTAQSETIDGHSQSFEPANVVVMTYDQGMKPSGDGVQNNHPIDQADENINILDVHSNDLSVNVTVSNSKPSDQSSDGPISINQPNCHIIPEASQQKKIRKTRKEERIKLIQSRLDRYLKNAKNKIVRDSLENVSPAIAGSSPEHVSRVARKPQSHESSNVKSKSLHTEKKRHMNVKKQKARSRIPPEKGKDAQGKHGLEINIKNTQRETAVCRPVKLAKSGGKRQDKCSTKELFGSTNQSSRKKKKTQLVVALENLKPPRLETNQFDDEMVSGQASSHPEQKSDAANNTNVVEEHEDVRDVEPLEEQQSRSATSRATPKGANNRDYEVLQEGDASLTDVRVTLKDIILTARVPSLAKSLKHDKTVFVCDTCDKIFVWRENLKPHQITHTGEKPFKCRFCDQRFSQNGGKRRHERLHTNERTFACDCGRTFNTDYQLKSHEKVHQRKFYECTLCDRKFWYDYALDTHIRVHHNNEKKRKCPKCDMSFKYNSQLKLHYASHLSEKPYSCDQCDFKCKTKRNLRTHMKTHSNVKAYRCTTCGQAFLHLCTLKNHIRTHTGEKPFKCKYCGRGFSQQGNRGNHEKICPDNYDSDD